MCRLISCSALAQLEVRKPEGSSKQTSQVQGNNVGDQQTPGPLSADDGLSVIAAALDGRMRLTGKRDCSHLVHAIYARAGFPYTYVRSSDLYAGTDEFQRVTDPQPGDLVVWRGHVGIVVHPAQHIFFSAMRSGLGIDSYDAPYWKRRGQPRFYRYIKGKGSTNSQPAFVLTHRHE